MRYDITNIPIAEVFEEGDGCPICRLRNTLENRAVESICTPPRKVISSLFPFSSLVRICSPLRRKVL